MSNFQCFMTVEQRILIHTATIERRLVPSVATTTILLLFLQACTAFPVHHCPASTCSKILNIRYPFRLRGNPPGCGDKRYELDCENNATLLTLFSAKYHVHHIDYKGYKIQVSDAGVMEYSTCSFIPRYFLSSHNFSQFSSDIWTAVADPLYLEGFDDALRIAYINCANPITNDPRYVGVDTTRCGSGRHLYAVLHEYLSNDFSVMAARGTIGYMTSELFYHNIEGVLYKANIYSFGMLLMEMASRRKNLNIQAEHSSELFFPLWIDDQLSEENNKGMENITIEENNNDAKKMFLVELWCIQLKPSERPSMNKVVEMLEGELENIEMPPKPSMYPHDEMIQEDLKSNSDQTLSDDSIGSTLEESIVHNS